MRPGIAIEQMSRLTHAEQVEIVRLAARLGYGSAWTPAPAALEQDAFQISLRWWEASCAEIDGGMTIGIAVVPLPFWSVPALAIATATIALATGGRFILGIGPSTIHIPSFRARYGLERVSPLALVRDHLATLRPLLQGETVTYAGEVVRLREAALAFEIPRVPVDMSALGPKMLELAGRASDGVCLNWCTSDQISLSRGAINASAGRAGRPLGAVKLVQSIRVAIDADPDVARRRLAGVILNYALSRTGSAPETGYRGHFTRMGFDLPIRELERMRDQGAADADLADAFPPEILRQVAYFGDAAGAPAAVERLSRGLDLALIRPVVPVGDARAVAEVLTACAPAPALRRG